MNDRPPSTVGALLDLRALAALLAGGVTAAATGLWWLLLPAGVLYAVLVRAAMVEAKDPLAWTEPELRGIAPQHQITVEAAVDVQRRLNDEIRSSPPYLQESLRTIWAEVRTLGSRQLVLIRQKQSLEECLIRLNPETLKAQERDLAARRKQTSDVIAAQQYDQALEALRGQARNVEDLRINAERIDAQLQAVQHALENVYGQVLRIKTAETHVGETVAGELNTSLQGLSRQVSALSEAVDQVYLRTTRES
jgi:hypothetical protein